MKRQDPSCKPLSGWCVLVPRGGPWGDGVAASLRSQGATPVIAPLINFAPSRDPGALDQALADLGSGQFNWVTITSATTVDVLTAYQVRIPEETHVAAVGETTASALAAMGYRVDLVPDHDNSAEALAKKLIGQMSAPQNILTLRSEIARTLLTDRLTKAGHSVRSVIAYRTVGVPVSDRIAEQVRSGHINAVLVTSGSVAEQVRQQFGDMPDSTVIAVIGPRTAEDARRLGLRVNVVAEVQTVDALIAAVAGMQLPHAADEFTP